MESVLIEVKRKHIEGGEPRPSYNHPLILACDQAGLGVSELETKTITVFQNQSIYVGTLPHYVSKWIQKYDRTETGNPFTFLLKLEERGS